MRQLIFFSLLILGLVACHPLERNCTDYKTGKFSFETLYEGQLVTTYFTRNDTLETTLINGKIDSSKVRWINDCEYIVRKINPQNRSEQQAVHFKILYTEGNSYTFEYSFVGKSKKEIGTANKEN